MYDVIHSVGTKSHTVLSNVTLSAARLYAKGTSMDVEIVPHRASKDDQTSPFKVGQFVLYAGRDVGRVKSLADDHCFVVYRCNGDWDDYANYMATRTRNCDLSAIQVKQ